MNGIIDRLVTACATDNGVLTLVNMDNFILFNDIYGHERGDMLLEKCVNIINSVTEGDDIKGRLGGDEFVIFCRDLKDRNELAQIHAYINQKINEALIDVVGEDNNISMGISMGAVFVPEQGTDYEDLFHKADQALEYVKQSGGHNIAFYDKDNKNDGFLSDLDNLSKSMEESNNEGGALWLDHADFSIVYRFLRRYIQTYKNPAGKMLITFTSIRDDITDEEFAQIVKGFGGVINAALRKSDIMMQSRNNQFFLLLPELNKEILEKIARRFEKRWQEIGLDRVMNISINAEMIEAEEETEG